MYRILGIGELLWDMLPEGPQLGGAPANYSVMAARLGDHATIMSRLGSDPLGQQALEILRQFPVDCAQLQSDSEHPTGTVTVQFEDGQPSYTIHKPVAWDFFDLSEAWVQQAAMADAVCFGSLAQRHEQSRKTIHALVRATRPDCKRIFDVNLRSPYYSSAILRDSLQLATVVKMNDAEVPLVLELLGLEVPGQLKPSSLQQGAEALLAEFAALTLVAISRGGEGSLLVGRTGFHSHPGIPIQVADTIGAGDAFTAAMTHYLLRGASLAVLNEAGNRWGSFIASHKGAMPGIDPETLRNIMQQIEA